MYTGMLDEKDQSIFKTAPLSISGPPPYEKVEYPAFEAPLPPLFSGQDLTTINQFHIRQREDITGTYAVDPFLYVPNPQKRKGCCCSSKKADVSFHSKRGAVSLNLATRGSTNETSKAVVDLVTRNGDITVDLFSFQPGKNIHLDASSGRGQILVLIPRSFCGAIHIRGRKNGHHILPALSITSRLIKSTCCNRDNLFHVGEPSQSGEGTDFLELRSCQGKIIVGYSGEDSYEPNDTDCWQKGCGLSKA